MPQTFWLAWELHQLWGGPPDPRSTPWSASSDTRRRGTDCGKRDEGVPRRPGGPALLDLCRMPAGAVEWAAAKLDAIDGTDNFDFLLSGVPNLVGIQDPIPYLPDYHAESDTFDRVNQREEKATLAASSALLWGCGREPAEAQSADPCRSREAGRRYQARSADEGIRAVGRFPVREARPVQIKNSISACL